MTDPTLNDPPIDAGIGGYVRWRPRMVRLSVLEDVTTTLTNTGWTDSDLAYPFTVVEYFPEFAVYKNDAQHVNTMVLDHAAPQGLYEYELGLSYYQMYRINMAFYSQDEETGLAVFGDLSDRYEGLTDAPYVSLRNYNVGANPPLITRMEVTSFQWVKASLDQAPYEYHLWFAELIVRDFVDGNRTDMPT